MINLTYQQANAIANYICRQGLPLSASFQSDDSSDFIWESLEWLIENIKTWHTFPATLKLHATRMTTEEFIQLVCKLAGIILETEVVASEEPSEVVTEEETMIKLTPEQANKVAEYIGRQGLPVFATFESDDSSDFIWESLEWLIENMKVWQTTPETLRLQANRLNSEEFILFICKLAGITLG